MTLDQERRNTAEPQRLAREFNLHVGSLAKEAEALLALYDKLSAALVALQQDPQVARSSLVVQSTLDMVRSVNAEIKRVTATLESASAQWQAWSEGEPARTLLGRG